MRKCFSCKETKNLKSIFIEDCDCHFDSFIKPDYHSVCSTCFFESCSCGFEMHQASECLEDKSCENHEQTMNYYKYWGNYDYHWQLRKELKVKIKN